jgi:hypothetical protein
MYKQWKIKTKRDRRRLIENKKRRWRNFSNILRWNEDLNKQ